MILTRRIRELFNIALIFLQNVINGVSHYIQCIYKLTLICILMGVIIDNLHIYNVIISFPINSQVNTLTQELVDVLENTNMKEENRFVPCSGYNRNTSVYCYDR